MGNLDAQAVTTAQMAFIELHAFPTPPLPRFRRFE
jgi:hypothetical protein